MLIAGCIGVVYAWEPKEPLLLPSPVSVGGIVSVDFGPAQRYLVTGPQGTALIDSDGATRSQLDQRAIDVVLSRYGDRVTAYFCSATGLWSTVVTPDSLGRAEPINQIRCGAILKVAGQGTEPAGILVAGDGLTWLPIDKTGLGPPMRMDERSWTEPLLAHLADQTAIAERGGNMVEEIAPWGRSSFSAAGPISGLAYGSEGIAWTVTAPPSTTDATRRTTILTDSPGQLRVGPLMGPNNSDRVVLHAGDTPWYGVVPRNGTEQLRPAPIGAKALLVQDVNHDGCTDILIGGATQINISFGDCSDTAPMTRTEAPNIPTLAPIIMNGEVPSVNARVGEEYWGQLYFPDGKTRAWSASGLPVGMLVLPDGLVRFTPSNEQVGRHEVYIRGGAVTQKLAVVVLPGDPQAIAQAAPPIQTAPVRQPTPPPQPRCLVGLGLAGGMSYATGDWDRIGSGPIAFGGSPAAMIACDASNTPIRPFFGFDTAPTFGYYITSSLQLPHLAAVTLGVTFGNDTFRAGPYGTAGLVLLGAGVRFSWTPFRGPSPEVRRGFELRITGFIPSAPAGEAMLLWVWRG